MRGLDYNLDIYRTYQFSKCEHFRNGYCEREEGCRCRPVADMWAYMATILPEGYMNLTFHDFDGIDPDGNQVLEPSEVIKTKKMIWKYCWGNTWEKYPNKSAMSNIELDSISCMDNRFIAGTNLLIHGGKGPDGRAQKGKTLIASIIMQQAIRRKIYETSNVNSFDWIPFPVLKSHCYNQNKNDYSADEMWRLQDVDWLVIDDIDMPEEMSEAQRIFLHNSLDGFFAYRIEHRLPTIMVYQFDITGYDMIRYFGYSMGQMAHSKSTHIIQV